MKRNNLRLIYYFTFQAIFMETNEPFLESRRRKSLMIE